MVVYLEYLFLDNFAINSFLLYITSLVCKKKIRLSLILFSAAIGAGFSVAYPFIGDYNYIVKLLLAVFMVLVLKKYKSFKEFLFVLLTFYLVSFALAGVVLMVSSFTQTDLTKYNGKLQLFPFCIALGAFIITVMLNISIREFYKKRNIQKLIYNAEVFTNKICVKVNAYYDSGNQLNDPISGKPMVIISNRLYEKLALKSQDRITIKTLAGIKDIPVVPLEFKIYFHRDMNKIYKVHAGIANDMNEDYDIILHTDMMGETI